MKSDRTVPTFAIERVSPKMAAEWLKHNVSNRPLSPSTVNTYAAEMKRGEWLMNAETVKFDWNGKLLDAQHRLSAVIRAGIPVDFLVARNLDPAVFVTIDTGRVRTPADVLAMRGIKYQYAIAAAYRMLHRHLNRASSKRRVSNTQILAMLDHRRHKQLVERAYEAMKTPLFNRLITPSHLVYFYYMAAGVDATRACRFLETVASDQNTIPAAAKLRDRLIATTAEVITPGQKIRLAWMVESWNHYLKGSTPKKLSRVLDEVPEFSPAPRF